MNPQHTPGPWHMFSTPAGIGASVDEADVAHCHGFHTNRSRLEEEANARLIAAAPSLLAALEKARSYVEFAIECNGPDPAGRGLTVLNSVDAALRLAQHGADSSLVEAA